MNKEDVQISIQISLKFIPHRPTDINLPFIPSDNGLTLNRQKNIIWTDGVLLL